MKKIMYVDVHKESYFNNINTGSNELSIELDDCVVILDFVNKTSIQTLIKKLENIAQSAGGEIL